MAAQTQAGQKTKSLAAAHAGTAAVLAGAVGLALVPLTGSTYLVSALTEILILSIFALSLGFLMGFPKLVSLGHAAFFGVGAYAAGLVAVHLAPNIVLTLVAGLVLSLMLAVVIGALSLRSTGIYFLMLTLALAQMVYVVAQKWESVTGGTNGFTGIPYPELFGLIEFDRASFYYLVLILAVASYFLLRAIVRSPFGRVLVGIGSNEQRVRAIGYGTRGYKLTAFVLAGAVAGVSGALWAHHSGIVAPVDLHWSHSAEALIMVIVGGAGTLIGPMLGAALVWLLENALNPYTERSTMIAGIVFILFVFFARNGVAGIVRNLWERIRR
ncbi:MAG: branched-chain amino acid ABC transporter permease [Actinomycetota bacterium]